MRAFTTIYYIINRAQNRTQLVARLQVYIYICMFERAHNNSVCATQLEYTAAVSLLLRTDSIKCRPREPLLRARARSQRDSHFVVFCVLYVNRARNRRPFIYGSSVINFNIQRIAF